MAALSGSDRATVSATYMADASRALDPLGGVVRSDIAAAVAAVDDWVVANQASFNSALPTAARTGLTAAQKAKLLVYVVKKRYETGA